MCLFDMYTTLQCEQAVRLRVDKAQEYRNKLKIWGKAQRESA